MLHVVLRELWTQLARFSRLGATAKTKSWTHSLITKYPPQCYYHLIAQQPLQKLKIKRVLQEHFWKGHLCLKQNHCYHGKFEETRDFVLTSPRQSQPEYTSHPLPPVSTGHLQTLTAPGWCREPATDTTCAAIALIRPAPFPLPTNPYKTRSAAIISPRPCRACEKTKIFIKPGTTKNVGQIDWTFFFHEILFQHFLTNLNFQLKSYCKPRKKTGKCWV